MPVVEILCGMVGAGKSSYARRRAGDGALIVCHDDLTGMLHGSGLTPSGRGYEPALRGCYRGMEEDLVRRVINAGRDAVIDRTHLTRESRSRWVNFVRAFVPEVPVVAVTFPVVTPEVHARRRFVADPRGRPYEDWLMVARHHHAQAIAEPLSADEGFAEVRAGTFLPTGVISAT
jgi:predicted kinase